MTCSLAWAPSRCWSAPLEWPTSWSSPSLNDAEKNNDAEPPDVTRARLHERRLEEELNRVIAAIRAGMDPALAAGQTREIQASIATAKSVIERWERSHERVAPLTEADVRIVLGQAADLTRLLQTGDRVERAAAVSDPSGSDPCPTIYSLVTYVLLVRLGTGAPCRVRRAGTGRLAGQRGLTRGKWKSLRPSPAAVEADDERFIVLDWLDEGQAGRSRHCYGGGQRVGETEVGAGHAGGGSARGRAPTMRVDQVTAPLVAARGGDPPGEFDDLGETAGGEGIGDADPEGLAASQAAETGDVTGRVHDRADDAPRGERSECVLRRPALHVSGRVNPARHGPWVEPSAGELARGCATLKDFGYLRGGLRASDLPRAQPAA